jgi:hypothetical protein
MTFESISYQNDHHVGFFPPFFLKSALMGDALRWVSQWAETKNRVWINFLKSMIVSLSDR